MPGYVHDILLFCTGGIQARIVSDKCSERKNLVSALVHHWWFFAPLAVVCTDTGQISREIILSRVDISTPGPTHTHLVLCWETETILIMVEVMMYTEDETEDTVTTLLTAGSSCGK